MYAIQEVDIWWYLMIFLWITFQLGIRILTQPHFKLDSNINMTSFAYIISCGSPWKWMVFSTDTYWHYQSGFFYTISLSWFQIYLWFPYKRLIGPFKGDDFSYKNPWIPRARDPWPASWSFQSSPPRWARDSRPDDPHHGETSWRNFMVSSWLLHETSSNIMKHHETSTCFFQIPKIGP